MIEKNKFFYEAISEAIAAFEDRHYLGRKHFARLLGYRGPNANIQLSSALNTTSYNPANPKRLSVDQAIVALDEMDEDIRRDALERIVNRWGLGICSSSAESGKPEVMRIVSALLELGSHHGELEQTVREAIEDGVIDAQERKAIRKGAFALRKLARKLEEMTGVSDDE